MLSNQHQIRSDVIESGVHIQHLDQYLIDRNQLRNLRSFSIRVTWSATLHDWFWLQSHLRLNFLIFQNDVSARIDRISAQDGVQMAWTSPKISLARALRCTDWLPSSPVLLSHLEHVLLASLPSSLIIISSVLVTCPELSIYFLAQSTRSSYRFSSLPINNLPYSLLSSFQSNLSSKSIFQLNALFSYIWPILIPSLYRPFLAHFWTFLVPYILECPSWHFSIQYLYIDLAPCACVHMTCSWSYYLLFL